MSKRPARGSRRGLRRLAAVTSGLVVLALSSGCGLLDHGVYDTPLPGGADVGKHPVELTADFSDVLDLVPQSSVKVDDVNVGRVTKISLSGDGRSARVKFLVNDDVKLPAGTTARLQTTSLLGEKYIALVRPTTAAAGTTSDADLHSGDHLGQTQTSQAAEVEQVFGALSLVLNGGDIGQFQEISRELQKISDGRPEQIRSSLTQLNSFVTTLNGRRTAITQALDGLSDLSKTLNGDKDKIARALDGLSPGMKVLVDQRPQLVAMLRSLDRLSTVTVSTLDASQKDIVADLKSLQPILDQLAESGSDLPNALQILLTYPFPDSVLDTIKGDYVNAFITTNFRTLPAGCGAIGCSWPQPGGGGGGTNRQPTFAPPSLLPPTSSPTPGTPTPTIVLPGTPTPGSATPGTPSGTPSTPGGTPSSPATSPSQTPSESPSASGSSAPPDGIPDGSPDGSPDGRTGE